MGPEFGNGFFCIFVFFRLCSCASIDLNKVETPRMVGTSSFESDRWTTLEVETYSSGGYETVNDQTTHNVEMSTKDQSNPCLGSHQDFCIHGNCQYHREQNTTSCICLPGFSGERCHMFSLASKCKEGYDLTTVLPVVAVVLIVLCLTIFSLFVVVRHQKKHKHDSECEEKINLEVTP
ncbi:heparin-binding EGF-like growth factor b [Alosa pseudoharengus]|uniref:heparin-binding EGF-like growth factor b n=1 Tax=Alosa pseudoharengus TaxID=34774 RepID=UPI003F8CECF8